MSTSDPGTRHELTVTAVVTRDGDWYVARCLEVEAVSQGDTLEKALSNLREVLEVYLADEPPPATAGHPIITTLDVPIGA